MSAFYFDNDFEKAIAKKKIGSVLNIIPLLSAVININILLRQVLIYAYCNEYT